MDTEQNNEQAPVQKVEIVEKPQLSPEEQLTQYFQQEEEQKQNEQLDLLKQREEANNAEVDVQEEVEYEEDLQEDAESIDAQEESAVQDEVDEEFEASEEDDVEEIHLDSLADAAEHMGVEVADLYQLKVPVTLDDGSKVEISIGEWKDNVHHLIKQERESFAEQAKAVEMQQAQQTEHLQHQVTQATAMIQAMETELTGDINAVDWQKLRTENPGEYSAMMSEYEAKVKRLETYKQQITESMTLQQQQQAEAFQQQRAERLEQENALLVDKIPSWTNDAKRTAETQEIGNYLSQIGFTPEETGSIIDHRFIKIARDAMMFNKMDKSSPAKKKIVKTGKRTVKPGSKPTKTQQATEARKAQMDAFKKSGGSVDAAADLFKQLGL
jgi:hypothetical protein